MLDPLYRLVARGIVVFHDGLAPIFGQNSFLSYALAIVLIVMLVRLLIVPLFVRSVKAQRTMQMLQPHIKEIREKYKNDRQMMNQKIMELQKEHGNPLLGCLPLLLQIPLFLSLFHVFNNIAPDSVAGGGYRFGATSGLSVEEVTAIAQAKLGGVSLAAAFTNPSGELDFLGVNGLAVRVVCVVLIITMSLTTFITQKQIMARNGPADPQQQMIQKVLLYASPIFLAVFGFNFPIAVLLYWLTTNLWSMGQQHFIIKRMPPLVVNKSGAPAPAAATSGGGGLTSLIKGKQPAPEPAAPKRQVQVRRGPGATGADDADAGSGDLPGTSSADGAGSANGSSVSSANSSGKTSGSAGGAGRNVKPAKAGARPQNRPGGGGAKKRTGKGGSRRGGRR